jgi:antitoxin ParD1/3/4
MNWYTSASEVVREALRLLEEYGRTRAARLGDFPAELDRRLASLDRGEGVYRRAVFARTREKSHQRRRKRS